MRYAFLVTVDADTGEQALGKRDEWKPVSFPKEAPLKPWPGWALWLKNYAQSGDRGLGDIAARIIGAENSKAFKAWHLKIFDRECGCDGRQAWLNRAYPLP